MKKKTENTCLGMYVLGEKGDILYDEGIAFCFALGMRDEKGNGYFAHINPHMGRLAYKVETQSHEFLENSQGEVEAIIGGSTDPSYQKEWDELRKELGERGIKKIREVKYKDHKIKRIELPLKTFKFNIYYIGY